MKKCSLYFIFLLAFIFLPVFSEAATLVRPPNNLGLVGYWPLNEGAGTNVTDVSGFNNTGTATAGATWTTGKRGKAALAFDGNAEVAVTSNSLNLSSYTSMTVSIWVKPSTLWSAMPKAYPSFIGAANSWGMYGEKSNNKITFYIDNGSGVRRSLVTDNASVANTWVNVTGTCDGTTMILYINGVAQSTTSTCTGGFENNNGFTLGRSDTSQNFVGSLDEPRIYSRALTAAQVAALYQSGSVVRKQASNQGLVGYWSFNEGTSTTVGDSSGKGNMGTLTNFALSGATSNWTPSGKKGSALDFDGVDDYVELGSNNALNPTEAISISLWAYQESGMNSYGNIISTNNDGVGSYQIQHTAGNNAIECKLRNSVNTVVLTSTAVIKIEKWQHIVCIYNGTNAYIFVDGVQVASTSRTGSLVGFSSLKIGSPTQALTRYYKGKIDDVRIYSRALSNSEVVALYRQNETRINSSQNNELTNGLVGLWSFNGADTAWSSATAGIAYDRSGQGNHGTITNMSRTTSPTSGRVGQGLLFDGVNDYVNSTDFFYSDTFTVCAWAKPSLIDSNFKSIVTKRNLSGATAGTNDWSLIWSTSGVGFTSWSDGTNGISLSITSDTVPSANQWHHICGVQNGNGNTGYIYVDGAQNGSATQAAVSYNGDSVVQVGALTAFNTSRYWNGLIDEVRIYNRALSAAEVLQLYNLGK